MRGLLEQPQLGAHVIAAPEGQGAGVNPRGRRTVQRLQLTLSVVGELVLDAHGLLGLLGDFLQPAENMVEADLVTDRRQRLANTSLPELRGDDAAYGTGGSRRQRQRDLLVLAVHLADVLQGDHGVVGGIIEELRRGRDQVLVHASNPVPGNIKFRHAHGVAQLGQLRGTRLRHRVADRDHHRTCPPLVLTGKHPFDGLGRDHARTGRDHRTQDVRLAVVQPTIPIARVASLRPPALPTRRVGSIPRVVHLHRVDERRQVGVLEVRHERNRQCVRVVALLSEPPLAMPLAVGIHDVGPGHAPGRPALGQRVLVQTQRRDGQLQRLTERQPRHPATTRTGVGGRQDDGQPQPLTVSRIDGGELVGHDAPRDLLALTDPTAIRIDRVDGDELGVEPNDDRPLSRTHPLHRRIRTEAARRAGGRPLDRLGQHDERGRVLARGRGVGNSAHPPPAGGSGGNGAFPIGGCRQ